MWWVSCDERWEMLICDGRRCDVWGDFWCVTLICDVDVCVINMIMCALWLSQVVKSVNPVALHIANVWNALLVFRRSIVQGFNLLAVVKNAEKMPPKWRRGEAAEVAIRENRRSGNGGRPPKWRWGKAAEVAMGEGRQSGDEGSPLISMGSSETQSHSLGRV